MASGTESLAGRQLLEVEQHTADDTLTAAESGTYHGNKGASGTITLTLPAATVGLRFGFYVGAAQALQIQPVTGEKMSATATGVAGAASTKITADAIGESMEIACFEAGIWSLLSAFGTWTIA